MAFSQRSNGNEQLSRRQLRSLGPSVNSMPGAMLIPSSRAARCSWYASVPSGANPVDTLLASLCSCMGHYVRDHFEAKGTPLSGFRVSAECDTSQEAARILEISVRIDLGRIQLDQSENVAVLADIAKCKVYGTLRQACQVHVMVTNRETETGERRRDFDKEAQSWDDNPLRRELGEALGKILAASLPLTSADTVLDYGAGTGLVSLALCPKVSQVLAADSSQGMLDVLAAKIKAAGIVNLLPVFLNLEDPTATPPRVDAIVSSMALHHVRDIPRLAGRFFSMLGPGGRIAVADLCKEAGDFHPDNTGVFHFGFVAEWLRDIFASAGFADVSTKIAYNVRKQTASGESKDFPILLLTAIRR
jgi:ubiquinone/menaquinone biosynthesis C-methylase UbiE/uncharacterized OsmC-like protein